MPTISSPHIQSLALFVAATTTLSAGVVSTEGLLAYWQLDGDLTDAAPLLNPALSGLGYDGTYTGGEPSFISGRNGLAVDFRGASGMGAYGHLIHTGLALGGGPKTLVLWVASELVASSERTIWAGNAAGSANRFYPGLYTRSNVWVPWLGGGTANDRNGSFHSDPNDGEWHLYVLTDTGYGGVLTIYQDGNPAPCYALDYSGSTASLSPYLFVIGGGGGTGEPRYANARIDDVAVFDRILTVAEMAAIHAAGSLWTAVVDPPLPDFLSDLDGSYREFREGDEVILGPVALTNPVGAVNHQWYFKGNPIPGATGSTLVIPAAGFYHGGVYRVMVSDGRDPPQALHSRHTWLVIKPGQIVLPQRGISAHRGENSIFPENTLPAFREAIRLGAQQIELDVFITNHGELVVIHDTTVNRTTNGTGDVRLKSLDEIKALDAGSWKGPQFAGEQIPTLEEVLAIMPHNVWLNLDLKGGNGLGSAVAGMVLDHGRTHQAFLAASRQDATQARAVYGNILICNMTRRGSNVDLYIDETMDHGDAFIQLRRTDGMPTAAQIQRLKDAGVTVNFFGSNNTAELQSLYELGIDFPLADNLASMIHWAAQLGNPPVRPVYLHPVSPHPTAHVANGRVQLRYLRSPGDALWELTLSADLINWVAQGDLQASLSQVITEGDDGTETVQLVVEDHPAPLFFRLRHGSWWW
jgi:glycerophosphoryl diester phosphodiesterase